MKKLFLSTIFLFSVFSFMFYVPAANAAVSCQPIYGGGQSCIQVGPVYIKKLVSHPKTGSFVDSLDQNADKFSPDQSLSFQITVTNTGTTMLPKVTIKDTFPREVKDINGPGALDTANKILTYELSNLNPGESRTNTISAKIISAGELADGITCAVNQSTAAAESESSQSNVKFCIQKLAIGAPGVVIAPTAAPGVTGVPVTPAEGAKGAPITPAVTKGGKVVFPAPAVTITPPTGPEALALLGLLPTGALGYFLRKKSILR